MSDESTINAEQPSVPVSAPVVTLTSEQVDELHEAVNKLCALEKTLHHPGLSEAVTRLAMAVVRLVPKSDGQ